MMSLIHAKKLLQIHGYDSFSTFLAEYFDLTKKGKKNVALLKSLKATKEFTAMEQYIEETKNTKNHPKLCKLAEILIAFFSDPIHKDCSKVIVFS